MFGLGKKDKKEWTSSRSAPPAAGGATTSMPASALTSVSASRVIRFTMREDDDFTVLDPAYGPEPVVIKAENAYERKDCRAVVGRVRCEHGVTNCVFQNHRRDPGHYTGAGTLVMAPDTMKYAYIVSPKLSCTLVVVFTRCLDQVEVEYFGIRYSVSSGDIIERDGFKVERDGNDVTVTIL